VPFILVLLSVDSVFSSLSSFSLFLGCLILIPNKCSVVEGKLNLYDVAENDFPLVNREVVEDNVEKLKLELKLKIDDVVVLELIALLELNDVKGSNGFGK